MIQERAYAKINLGLEVGPLRQDGYHEMNTIMVPIDLYDELTFDFKEEEGILLIDNTNINTPAIIDTYIANSGLYCFRITIIISASKPIPIILITSVIFSSYSLLFGIDYKSNNVLTVLNNELIC